jgi:hypothetical protein
LLLLFGYQPRDCEISNNFAVGLPKFWPIEITEVYSHVHAPTLKAITELLERYGFKIQKCLGFPWGKVALLRRDTKLHKIFKAVFAVMDEFASKKPSLAFRVFIIAQKAGHVGTYKL